MSCEHKWIIKEEYKTYYQFCYWKDIVLQCSKCGDIKTATIKLGRKIIEENIVGRQPQRRRK